VVKDGKVLPYTKPPVMPRLEDRVRNSFHLAPLEAEDFHIEPQGTKCRVIGVIEEQIITNYLIEEPDFSVNNGISVENDLLKVSVIERHRGTGHMMTGFIKGVGLKKGAIASSVSHDCHNLIVIGTNDEDMAFAANKIREMGGGNIVVADGEVLASLALPIAGLMSEEDAAVVAANNMEVHRKAHELGVPEKIEPFMNMAFVSLAVIPSLKIGTRSLIDVENFEEVDLFVE
ncbi:MAG: hypothetical protein IJM15_09455, partial [Erysipelotrichaceae bacterium]|nr:hypothetical protein [Erysipelotrichaceae bacterium]